MENGNGSSPVLKQAPPCFHIFPVFFFLSSFLYFFNLFLSLCFPYAFSISPPGSPFLLGLSSGFYSQRMHALLHEYSNGRRALAVKCSPWLKQFVAFVAESIPLSIETAPEEENE